MYNSRKMKRFILCLLWFITYGFLYQSILLGDLNKIFVFVGQEFILQQGKQMLFDEQLIVYNKEDQNVVIGRVL